jgi:hypothetical protein
VGVNYRAGRSGKRASGPVYRVSPTFRIQRLYARMRGHSGFDMIDFCKSSILGS